MALVAAICTQCGGQIEVDDTKDAGICRHCGTAFVTEKVINQYNSYVNHNYTGTNIFYGQRDVETEVANGDKLIELREYERAEVQYEKIVSDFPGDYRGWWGLILCKTRKFVILPERDVREKYECVVEPQLDEWYSNVCKLASDEQLSELEGMYLAYAKRANEVFTERYIEVREREMAGYKERIKDTEKDILDVKQNVSEYCKAKAGLDEVSDREIAQYANEQKQNKKSLRWKCVKISGMILLIGIAGISLVRMLHFLSYGESEYVWALFGGYVVAGIILCCSIVGIINAVEMIKRYEAGIKKCIGQVGEWNRKKQRDQAEMSKFIRESNELLKKIEMRKRELQVDYEKIKQELAQGEENLKQQYWKSMMSRIRSS